jgi:hypothetical protein
MSSMPLQIPRCCPHFHLQVFKDEVFLSLQSIKDKFAFTFINADGSPEVVKQVGALCAKCHQSPAESYFIRFFVPFFCFAAHFA